MAYFAVLSGNIVNNVIVANTLEDAQLVVGSQCIEYTDENPAGIGYIYNEETGLFSNPNEVIE